jgi:16S rRNA (cytidine1402-2'-O)-methyltransferase
MSTLYLVATPIGNLEDISFRALRILREVPLIAAEDTRTSGVLLKHYQISTPLTSYHDHNKEEKTGQLLERLKDGDLALVSDAGTPGINDPGYNLVQVALKAGHLVVPVPGPSAPVAALSASGLASDRFCYLGYLPRKSKARQDLLDQVKGLPWTLIFLETPRRLLLSLEDCKAILGERDLAVARELTKFHEEIFRGKFTEAIRHFSVQEPKGEFTLVIAGSKEGEKWSREKLLAEIQESRRHGRGSPSQQAKLLAELSGWSRKGIYDLMRRLDEGEN